MGDGMGDCARRAELRARDFVKKNYPSLKEFNPYHIPTRGEGFIIYEDWLDHILAIVDRRVVIKAWKFDPFHKTTRLHPGKKVVIEGLRISI